LNVDPENAEVANSILDQPIPEGFDVAGVGEYQQPRCPKCQSFEVTFRELDRPGAFVSAYLNVPIPLQRAAWRCHECRAEWEDDGVEGGGSEN
jgi:predicted nucleic-acid-binding Zn-ribbon protein